MCKNKDTTTFYVLLVIKEMEFIFKNNHNFYEHL